uniref:Ubiquitin carboxyl-terminal hydrolase 47 C-terminal domain-containing protein n=1 Tax=Amphimedon queenslandica TaxID=400682 RepID=A0A1X7UIM3_AMPQE
MKKFATHDSFTKQRENDIKFISFLTGYIQVFESIAELSGVTVDAISVATYLRSFPAEISRLDIANELQWNQASLYDADGDVIYYKDNREELKITTEDREEIKMTESKRCSLETKYVRGESHLRYHVLTVIEEKEIDSNLSLNYIKSQEFYSES